MKLPFLTLACFLFPFIAVSQIELENFSGLKSNGPIPDDFTQITKEKNLQDKTSNKKKKKKDQYSKDILTETNYAIDRILQGGTVAFNDPVSNYVDEIVDILLKDNPKLRESLRIYTIKSDEANAFSTRQGILFVTTGLISRLENEAQLAFILAHEIAHFTEKHVVESYVENEKITKGKGEFRYITKDEKLKLLSRYSKDKEYEADDLGLELFLKSDYSRAELYTVFDVLKYSYLPFEEKVFDRSFFNDESLIIPEILFSDKIKPIKAQEEDYDDSESTHPNINKRKKNIISKLKEDEKEIGNKFLVGEEKFINIRAICRFEAIHIDLEKGLPVNAIYSIFLLKQDYPNNKYLDISLAKAWYKLLKYKNKNSFYDITLRAKTTEGEIYHLHYLIRKLNSMQLNVVALKVIYDIHKKFNFEDETLGVLFQNALASFTREENVNWSDFKDYSYTQALDDLPKNEIPDVIIHDTLVRDSSVINNELEKMEQIEPINSEYMEALGDLQDNFHLYAFSDILEEKQFLDFKETNNKLVNNSKEGKSLEDFFDDDYADRKKRKKIQNKGAYLGLEDLIVLSPEFQKWHFKRGFEYKNTEKGNIEIAKTYRESCEKLDLNFHVLDKKELSETSIDDVNDLNELMSYVKQITVFNDDYPFLPSNFDQVKEIVKRRGTSHVLMPLIIIEEEQRISKGAYFYLIPPFTPIFIVKALIPNSSVLIINVLYNLEENTLDYVFFKYFKSKMSSIPFVQAHIYDIMYQISSKRKGAGK